jgi:sulfate adenylyltransferase
VPESPELRLDGNAAEPLVLAQQIIALLRDKGLIDQADWK